MAKNGPKPYNVTTSNVFLTQKWPKRAKQEFSQTQHCYSMIQSNCPKFLTKFQTNLMCGFEENVRKPDFWLKMAKNGKNWPFLAKILKTRIFSKIRLKHFFRLIKIQLCAKKSSKPDGQFSRYGVTKERTNAGKDECESIGLQAKAE